MSRNSIVTSRNFKIYSKLISTILFFLALIFYPVDVSAEFLNMRAEWQLSCGGLPPQVPNKALDLSWDYNIPPGVSNWCRVTVTDSLNIAVWTEDVWCGLDVIEYSGPELTAGNTYHWKVGRYNTNRDQIIDESSNCSFATYDIFAGDILTNPSFLPKNREHIRLARYFGSVDRIIANKYDLSLSPEVKSSLEKHIAIPYELNVEMGTPYPGATYQLEKPSQLKAWWCTTKDINDERLCSEDTFPDTWFCADPTQCDIPEEMFMHFKVDTQINNLYLGVWGLNPEDDQTRSGIVKGWDQSNDLDGDGIISDTEWAQRINQCASARNRQEARVPSFYWGYYWQYLTGETVTHHSNFIMNVGNADYQEFMSKYISDFLVDNPLADGIFFDDATTGYWEVWQNWGTAVCGGYNNYVEYGSKYAYIANNMKLLKAIKTEMSDRNLGNKIIIGNAWSQFPSIIEGRLREGGQDISMPYEGFNKVNSIKPALSAIDAELKRGLINIIQFNPAYGADYTFGIQTPVTRERDQIYALAGYYLVAGERSYFAYGMHPYPNIDILFFNALNVDVGKPNGNYEELPGSKEIVLQNEEIITGNLIDNGKFENMVDPMNCNGSGCNDPAGWTIPALIQEHLEVTDESECNLVIDGENQGNCAKISRNDTAQQWAFPSQQVALVPGKKYILSGYIKTLEISGGYGANISAYQFDIVEKPGNEIGNNDVLICDRSPVGTTGSWMFNYCTFTPLTNTGTIYFRIQGGTGTAYFDNIELREDNELIDGLQFNKALSRIVLTRDYSKAKILVRPRATDREDYGDEKEYILYGSYVPLNADGSLDSATTSVWLKSGEAAILIKDNDGDGYPVTDNGSQGLKDCDDTDNDTHPGAPEICDVIDNNCNGLVDEGVQNNYFRDADGDGYGDPGVNPNLCDPTTGYVQDSLDCDDNNASVKPGAIEICNDDLDNNCDGIEALCSPSNWYPISDWPYRQPVSIEPGMTTATTEDPLRYFPVLVEISGISNAQADGDDIVFTLSDGITKLDHEIEKYEAATGSLIAWVELPVLSSSGSTIYMYYGNPNAPIQENPEDVWDSNYVMVQHLDETSGQHFDSTLYNNDSCEKDQSGTCIGSGVYVTAQGQTATAKIVGADEFDAIDDYINIADKGINAPLDLVGNTSVSYSAWIYTRQNQNKTGGIIAKILQDTGYRGFGFDGLNCYGTATYSLEAMRAGKWGGTVCSDYDAVTPGMWEYVVYTYDSSNGTGQIYVNGAQSGPPAIGSVTAVDTSADLIIGKWVFGKFDGYIDEVRISNTARTPEWIEAEYRNQNNPESYIHPLTQEIFCTDADDDGYAVEGGACGLLIDCNDADPAINSSAAEICDGVDNNCNSHVDDALIAPLNDLQAGVCSGSVKTCNGTGGWMNNYAGIANYESTEITCDIMDNDCDGETDEGLNIAYYQDADSDTFGNLVVTAQACDAPVGYVMDSTDCDDSDASVNPGTVEIHYNGKDDDCNASSLDNDIDVGFNPNANNAVNAIAMQADGKILIGGGFTTVNGTSRNRIARLNADGSLDTSFNPNANGAVYSIAQQADGKILIGGYFTTVGGITRNRIARLNADGSLDISFNPNANNAVRAIAEQADGKILIGGLFTTVSGTTRNRIAILNADGSLDTSFNLSANGFVFSIAEQADGKMLIGGTFTTVGGTTRNRIARLNTDGSLDTSFNPGSNVDGRSIAEQADGKILIGGFGGIARLNADGSLDASFNPSLKQFVFSIAVQADGKIITGGTFYSIEGTTISRLNADGSLDTSFNPSTNGMVLSIAQQEDGKIIVGGDFTTINGTTRNRIARF